jgi:hypothetical protein
MNGLNTGAKAARNNAMNNAERGPVNYATASRRPNNYNLPASQDPEASPNAKNNSFKVTNKNKNKKNKSKNNKSKNKSRN